MEILDVVRDPAIVATNEPFRITFKIVGALNPFQFPFSNESLTEKEIVFIKEG